LKILCAEFVRRGVSALYGNMADILDHLRQLLFEDTRGDRYWERLIDIPVLLIDEVTNFNAKPWAWEQVFRLIDIRHRRMGSHVTCFALNDDPGTMLAPGTEDNIGYLYSRMRSAPMVLLEHDVRPALREQHHGK
jgi:DNA replication protein DnaC